MGKGYKMKEFLLYLHLAKKKHFHNLKIPKTISIVEKIFIDNIGFSLLLKVIWDFKVHL